MDNQKHYKANFIIDNKVVKQITDDDKDKLIAQATELLESTFNNATCTIEDTKTQTVIHTLKRDSVE